MSCSAKTCCRLVGVDRGLGLVDQRALLAELGHDAGNVRFGLGDISFRLIDRGLVVARIDRRQNVSGLHRLIVVDEYRLDISRDLRRDGDYIGLHVRVVSRFLEPP